MADRSLVRTVAHPGVRKSCGAGVALMAGSVIVPLLVVKGTELNHGASPYILGAGLAFALVFLVSYVASHWLQVTDGLARVEIELRQAQGTLDPTAPLPQRVVGRLIRTADFPRVVHGRSFDGCEFIGTVRFQGGGSMNRTKWLHGSFRSPRQPPKDTMTFIDCSFDDCEFNDCAAVGTPEQNAAARAMFGITDDNPDYLP